MYQICICDDEEQHRKKLKRTLLDYSFRSNREFHVVEYETTQQLYAASKEFDIIFLDIDFPEGESGVQVAKKLRAVGNQSVIIFQTAYPQYSLEGYEAEAFRYLLKPITVEKTVAVMDAVFSKWERSRATVSIRTPGGAALLDTARIQRVEAEGRKQKIYCDTGVIETWEPLKELAKKLPESTFAVAHQGCIANLEYVREISGSTVLMADGAKITLSRRQKKAFILCIDKMLEHDK